MIEIGYILKPHGIKGELKINFRYPLNASASFAGQSFFIGDLPRPLPHFIQQITPMGREGYLLKLQESDDRNQAETFTGKNIFVTDEIFDLLFLEEEDIQYGNLEGFTALDEKGNSIAVIHDVFEFNHQFIAQFFISGNEILLPLNLTTVIKIQKRKKTVTVILPDGLMDVYLESPEKK